MAGGWLSDPVDKYPDYFDSTGLFKTYPYLLPSLLSASLTLTALVLGSFILTETLDPAFRSE